MVTVEENMNKLLSPLSVSVDYRHFMAYDLMFSPKGIGSLIYHGLISLCEYTQNVKWA
jgi:hypothetical protein